MVFLYSSDRNYAKLSMVSIASLLENNQDAEYIKIYYINNNIGADYEEKLNNLVKSFGREIVYIDATKIDTSFIAKTWFSVSGYYRILVTEMIPESKIIYLDCDTVVNGSFKGLWNLELDNYLFGGVKDTVQDYVATSVGQANNSFYINSGFLYMNLAKLRNIGFNKRVRDYFCKYNGLIPHYDQGVVNALGYGKILYLSPRYNFTSQFFTYNVKQLKSLFSISDFYSQQEMNEAKTDIVVIHYLNYFYGRPWKTNCQHPMLKYFDDYAKKYKIDIDKVPEPMAKEKLLRCYIQKYLPFAVHMMIERLLDKKREYFFWKIFKKQSENEENSNN